MANQEEERQGYPPEVIAQMYADQITSAETDRRPRKPLTGYPFSQFGEEVNGPIRDFLFQKVRLSEKKGPSKKGRADSE